MKKHFSKPEAEGKVGTGIRTLVEFSGVPQGTNGVVIRADSAGHVKSVGRGRMEVYDVVIEWDLPTRTFGTRPKPLCDWFSKDEYERFLVEV